MSLRFSFVGEEEVQVPSIGPELPVLPDFVRLVVVVRLKHDDGLRRRTGRGLVATYEDYSSVLSKLEFLEQAG